MEEPPHPEHAQGYRLLYSALGAAIIAIIALGFVIDSQYRMLQKEQLVGTHGILLTSLKSRGAITPKDGAFIEEWMTFNYINSLFSLPPAYLEQTLSISDLHYPHLTIEEYAEDTHADKAVTLEAVRSAVESYAPAQ